MNLLSKLGLSLACIEALTLVSCIGLDMVLDWDYHALFVAIFGGITTAVVVGASILGLIAIWTLL